MSDVFFYTSENPRKKWCKKGTAVRNQHFLKSSHDSGRCWDVLRTTQTEAFQDQRAGIPDEKSLGFSCTVGSAHHSTSIHGHITNLMQFFILLWASGLWLSAKAIKFKAVQGSDGCIWLRGRQRRVPATFTTEMCQQHYPVFTSRLFTHRDGRCSLALQDERFVTVFFCSAYLQGCGWTESSEFLVEIWGATVSLTYIWRRGWLLMLESSICTHKKKPTPRSIFERSSQYPIFERWPSVVLHNVRTKEEEEDILSSFSCCFQSMQRGSGVKHRFPHFLLAKKVKLNVQPYVSLNDPANFSVCWSLACFQVLLMYSSSAQRASW